MANSQRCHHLSKCCCLGTFGLHKLIRFPNHCIFQTLCPAHQELTFALKRCREVLSNILPCCDIDCFFFSILVRQQQFFQHNSVKSNSHCWLQVFILAIELLISFNCQQKLSWRSRGAGLSPKFTFRVSHCSWFLPSVTLEESRSSSNYA